MSAYVQKIEKKRVLVSLQWMNIFYLVLPYIPSNISYELMLYCRMDIHKGNNRFKSTTFWSLFAPRSTRWIWTSSINSSSLCMTSLNKAAMHHRVCKKTLYILQHVCYVRFAIIIQETSYVIFICTTLQDKFKFVVLKTFYKSSL